jgi:hypothetical protein
VYGDAKWAFHCGAIGNKICGNKLFGTAVECFYPICTCHKIVIIDVGSIVMNGEVYYLQTVESLGNFIGLTIDTAPGAFDS